VLRQGRLNGDASKKEEAGDGKPTGSNEESKSKDVSVLTAEGKSDGEGEDTPAVPVIEEKPAEEKAATEAQEVAKPPETEEAMRVALLRGKYKHSISYAKTKGISTENVDPKLLEEQERRIKEERARLEMEAMIAEEARKKKEAELLAEQRRKREEEREAERQARLQMEKTVHIDENAYALRGIDGSQFGVPRSPHRSAGGDVLEGLGLLRRKSQANDEEDDDTDDDDSDQDDPDDPMEDDKEAVGAKETSSVKPGEDIHANVDAEEHAVEV